MTNVEPPPQKRGGFLWILAAIGLALGLTLFIVGTLLLSRDRSDQRTSTQTQLNNIQGHVKAFQNKAERADSLAKSDSSMIYAICIRFKQDEAISERNAINAAKSEKLSPEAHNGQRGAIYYNARVADLNGNVARNEAQVAQKCPHALLDSLKNVPGSGNAPPSSK